MQIDLEHNSHAAWPFKSSDGSHIEMRRHRPRSSPKPSMPVRFVFFAPGRAPVGPIRSRHRLTVQYCIEMPVQIQQWSIPQILDAPHGRKDQDGHCLTVRVLENLISHVRDRDTVYFHRRIFPLMCLILMPRHSYFHHGVFLQ